MKNTKPTKQPIQRVRLRRKFNHRQKFDYIQQLVMIIRIQIVFQLITMLLICLLRLSLDIKSQNIFISQFWTTADVKNNNIAIGLSLIMFCPYLILIEKIKVNLIKDCYFTVLVFHFIASYINSKNVQTSFVLFIVITGYVVATITQYLSMVLEQKKLIQQINIIEAEDRKVIKFQESQFSSLTTFEMYDSK